MPIWTRRCLKLVYIFVRDFVIHHRYNEVPVSPVPLNEVSCPVFSLIIAKPPLILVKFSQVLDCVPSENFGIFFKLPINTGLDCTKVTFIDFGRYCLNYYKYYILTYHNFFWYFYKFWYFFWTVHKIIKKPTGVSTVQ